MVSESREEEIINLKNEHGRKPWDDITTEYLGDVEEKTINSFQEEYEGGDIVYSVKDVKITEIKRSEFRRHATGKYRVDFKFNPEPDYSEELYENSVIVNSDVEYDSTNITSFEDKVFDKIKDAIEEANEDSEWW